MLIGALLSYLFCLDGYVLLLYEIELLSSVEGKGIMMWDLIEMFWIVMNYSFLITLISIMSNVSVKCSISIK